VTLLLRLTAVFSVLWAVLLIGCKQAVFGAQPLSWLAATLANGVAAAYAVLGWLFWRAARHPAAHRGSIYAAIGMFILKWAFDTYGVLLALSPDPAMISLADLIISISLLVGILESLPKMLSAAGSK